MSELDLEAAKRRRQYKTGECEARGCETCEPRLDPADTRQGAYHRAVRFGDWLWTVKLNGQAITDCYEVKAGPGGCAWCVATPPRPCSCGSGAPEKYITRSDGFSVHAD
jgi:hypothetical protein